eukprot:5526255-Pyramimonas_sp.AAC.1
MAAEASSSHCPEADGTVPRDAAQPGYRKRRPRVRGRFRVAGLVDAHHQRQDQGAEGQYQLAEDFREGIEVGPEEALEGRDGHHQSDGQHDAGPG